MTDFLLLNLAALVIYFFFVGGQMVWNWRATRDIKQLMIRTKHTRQYATNLSAMIMEVISPRGIWANRTFQSNIQQVLVWCSETIESEAECLKEGATRPDGTFMDEADQRQYEFEIGKVSEINALLEQIGGSQ